LWQNASISLIAPTAISPSKSWRRSVRKRSVKTLARTVGPQSTNTIGSYRGLIFDLSITCSRSLVVPVAPGFTSPIAQAAELPASTLTRQESLQPLRARPTQIKLSGDFYGGQREFPVAFR